MSSRPFSRQLAVALLACGALSVSAAALADAAAARTYKGKTAQKRSIKVAVGKSKLKMLRFQASLRCRDGSILVVTESGFLPTRIRGNGRFHDVQVGSTDEVFIRGKRQGKVVRGTVRVKDRLSKGGTRCDSKWVKFSARAGR